MKESIKYLTNKIKLIVEFVEKDDIFVILLIILISLASFGLGRLSKIDENKTSLLMNNTALVTNAVQNNIKGEYVASKTGSKYYLPWCSGAQRISNKNKVWFETKKEAENKGYQPAKNCKGI